ncbi:MAG: ribose transport system permease protein [Chloroflexota bacterium]|nr:ribose transport system permease protein [Chloroflexota bacterium]
MTDQSAVDPGETAPAIATAESARGRRLATLIQGQGLIAMALLIAVYFGLSSPFFFTTDNVLIIGATAAPLGIMALAQTFLIVSGGIDVSVGSVVAITTVAAGLLIQGGMDFWPAAGLAVLVGAGVGAINAILVVVLTINPFIATLGTLSVFQGLAFAVTGGKTIVVDDPTLAYIGIGSLFGLPLPFIVFIVLFIVALIFERFTRWGRTIYAIGGNAEAARLSGLRVKSTRAGLYILSGTAGGVAGVLILGQLSAASPQVGATFLLSVVTAVILGGASLSGGKGTVVGTLVAIVILGMLNNGFALLGSSSAAQQVALGVALIFAVLLEQTGRRLRRTEQ